MFTNRLPGKLSRTSVHASAVPVTALIPTKAAESPSVSSSAALASGFHATCQKWCQPPCAPFATSAASGIRTMTLRYPSASPLLSEGAHRPRRRPLDIRAASPASGYPQALLDLRDDSVRRVEELGIDLVPAADVADLEQLRPGRELRLERLRDGLV